MQPRNETVAIPSKWHSGMVEAYGPSLRFVLASLLVLGIFRAVFISLYWPRVDAVEGLATVLLQGLRFDVLIVCALVALPLAFAPWLSRYALWFKVERAYLFLAFLLLTFMECATPTFVAEYDVRPNRLFIEYLKYPAEVASMLWVGYKVPIAVSMAIIGALLFVYVRLSHTSYRRPAPVWAPVAVLCTVIAVLVCTMGIRSSVGHRPANPSVAAFSTDLLVNDLCLNSTYSVMYAAYASSRHESGVRAYARVPLEQAVQQVRADMAVDRDLFLSEELPTLHHPAWVKPRDGRPLNLVIVLEESLGAEYVGALGGIGVTPELDALTREGIWFNNLYATGTRSVRGIEAVVTGFTPTPARSVVKLPRSQSNFFTIAELLSRQGYDTSFMYGGEAHFDNMRQFFVGNGFSRIIEKKDIEAPEFVGSWGASDEDLFRRAHQEFTRLGDRPFFSLVFTSSNHSPFEFPEGRISLYEQPKATVNNAVKYADYALGEFIRTAKASQYWDNTLFLIVADHNSRVRGANLVPIEYFHVPALILGGGVEPQVYSRLASQIDLLPTLLGLMGIDSAHPATGHDLFRPDIDEVPGRAMMQYNQVQAYRQEDRVVILAPDQPPGLYRYTKDSGLTPLQQSDQGLIDRAHGYAAWSAAAYSEQLYRLPEPTDELPTQRSSIE
ncbi:MAG: LTA synthase family protein [Halioglobus sp.]